MNKKINLIYFASVRQITNIDSEIIETSSNTPREFYQELALKYHFKFPENFLKVAINEDYSNFDDQINDGDTLVFIPPVAGG